MTRPCVSVITPVYNASATIGRALDSVFAQRFTDYEVIVVDDGSNDGTRDVLRRYADRIRIVDSPHMGPGEARNRGAAVARGEFLAFLDADDVWYPTKLERQVELAEREQDVEFLSGDYHYIDESGRSLGTGFERIPWLMERMRTEAVDGLLVFDRKDVPRFLRQGFGATITLMLRRTLFDRIGGFCNWLSVAEDVHFAMRAVASARKFGAVCEPLATYFLHPASTTRQDGERAQRQTVLAYQDLRRMLATSDRPVRRALDDSLSRAHLDHATVLARLGRRTEGLAAACRSLWLRPRRLAFGTLVDAAIGGKA